MADPHLQLVLSDDELFADAIAADTDATAAEAEASGLRWRAADDYTELHRRGYTQTEIAERVSKSQPHISYCLEAVEYNPGYNDRPDFQEAYKKAKAAARQPRIPEPTLLPPGLFSVLYADPPWRYEHAPTPSRQIENQYPTMELDQIKALEVPAAEDAILFLWATSPKLTESLEVMAAWDFTYRTCMVWVKDKIGMGYYARQQHELLLIGKRGNMPAPAEAALTSSVIEAPRGRHSEKPERFYEIIEALYPGFSMLELFARNQRPGWATWGAEAA